MNTRTMTGVLKIEKTKDITAGIRKKRTAAYCRVSTGSDEQLESLKTQKDHYDKLIRSNSEWEYAGLYFDEGLSGTEMEHRSGLLSLISDCETGKIDRVIIKSISRLARNTVDSLAVVRKLSGLGITIYFEKENLDTGEMDSELLLAIMSGIAEDESHSISENCKWGCRNRFRSGTYNFGYVPYGYSADNGKLIVNPAEADTVRLIFRSYLEGMGSVRIAAMLDEKGIKPRYAERWNDNTIRQILRNEKYSGRCIFQKTYTDDRFMRHINRGEEAQYCMADHHEALISPEDYEKVLNMLAKRRKAANAVCEDERYRNRYPFSGKVFCGQCGSSFKRRIVYREKQSYPVMACRNHIDGSGRCAAKAVRTEALESAFTTMLNKLIFAREVVVRPYAESVKAVSVLNSGESLESIRIKLEDNIRKRQTLSNLYARNLIEQGVYIKENNALVSESLELSRKVKRCTAQQDGKYTRQACAVELLRIVRSTDVRTEFSAELFERIVERITVVSGKEVEFTLRCGLVLKEEI